MNQHTYNNLAYRGLIVALFVMGLAHVIAYWFYQPDDAFIYLVYVNNLIGGNGLTFNGEMVEGFSSVSWTILSALLAWPGLDPLQVAKVLGASSYLATAALLLIIQRHISPPTSWWQPAGLLLMFFSFPLLALWAPAAMEGILYALLITASCYVYFLASNGTTLKLYFFAGLLFGLLAITRPEGAAFIGAILVYEFSRAFLKEKVSWKGVLLTFVVFGILLAAVLIWRYSTYGELLPTTVSAKTGDLHQQIKHGYGYVARFTIEYFYLVIPYLLATTLLISRGGVGGWWAWIAFIFVSGYTAFNLLVGGDWMIGYRFMMPITPLLIAAPALVLQNFKLGTPLAVISFAAYSFWLSSQLHGVAIRERLATEGAVVMGKHIASMNLPADSKIAVVDAGAIPYYSGLPTIDMVGLNNKHISKVPGGFMAKWDNDYVLSEKPTIIQFHAHIDPISKELVPSDDFRGSQLLFYTEEFQRWYELDSTSIIPHLFIRREQPIVKVGNIYGFQAQAQLDDESSSLTLNLEKTGAGVWPTDTVSWQVIVMTNDGENIFQQFVALTKPMKQGNKTKYTVQLPEFKKSSYRVMACPVLLETVKFPQCNSGFVVDLLPSLKKEPVHGQISFMDPRLGFSGWSTPEPAHIWSLGDHSSITFRLENATALEGRLLLQASSFGSQQVTIMLNGTVVFTGQLNGDQLIDVAQAPYREGENLLEITTPDAHSPGGSDLRVLGIAFKYLAVQ